MIASDLLRRARSGIDAKRRVRSAYLRRAVSDAYYALFHALAFACANNLVGVTKRDSAAWRRIYRGLEHGRAKEEFGRAETRALHQNIARIGAAFKQLQEARHMADYDPATTLRRRSDAEALIGIAETAISDLDTLPADMALELGAYLLVRKRP